jgi:diketogulonate reductase-like aldo/keto reductase
MSFESSLSHLGTDYLDSYILHGPYGGRGLAPADHETWRKMEELIESKQVRAIGISNVSLEQLGALYDFAKVKPAFVQNRCFAETKWDQEIRIFCKENGIRYQGFSLLTANAEFLGGHAHYPEGRTIPQVEFSGANNSVVQGICKKYGKTIQQVIFRFALDVGMLPLTGTRTLANMKMNLDFKDFSLTALEIETIETIAFL